LIGRQLTGRAQLAAETEAAPKQVCLGVALPVVERFVVLQTRSKGALRSLFIDTRISTI